MTPSLPNLSLSGAQQNVLAATQAQVAALNADLKNRYLSSFQDFINQMLAGQPVGDPPKPPMGYDVAFDQGWAHPELGTTPVCTMPSVPPKPAVAQSQPGFGGNQAPTGDTTDLAAIGAKLDKLLAFFHVS